MAGISRKPSIKKEVAAPVEVSVVIPIYRGGRDIAELVRRVEAVLSGNAESFELVLVDDGSPDDSWLAIVRAVQQHTFVRAIRLARNFGQQISVSAGIAAATGQKVVVMDGDLQNPPEALPEILERLRAGDDLVYTVSKTRNDRASELTSRVFWFVLTRLLRVDIVRNQLMMRGMSRRFVDAYNAYPELTRTVAGITRDIGFRQSVIEVANDRRKSGKSGYNFLSRLNLMINMIISITTVPLSILIYVSSAVFFLTTLASLYYIVNALLTETLPGFTSVILAIMFFGSLTLIVLGIIGMYLANIYTEVRRRPLFLIDEEISGHAD